MIQIAKGRQLLDDPLELRSSVSDEALRIGFVTEHAGDRRAGKLEAVGVAGRLGARIVSAKPDLMEREIFLRPENGFPIGKGIFEGGKMMLKMRCRSKDQFLRLAIMRSRLDLLLAVLMHEGIKDLEYLNRGGSDELCLAINRQCWRCSLRRVHQTQGVFQCVCLDLGAQEFFEIALFVAVKRLSRVAIGRGQFGDLGAVTAGLAHSVQQFQARQTLRRGLGSHQSRG